MEEFSFILEDGLTDEGFGKCFREFMARANISKEEEVGLKMRYVKEYGGWVFTINPKS